MQRDRLWSHREGRVVFSTYCSSYFWTIVLISYMQVYICILYINILCYTDVRFAYKKVWGIK